MKLSHTEFLRYERHFPIIGLDGQKLLKQAQILCIGAGGLGCPALQYLAAAGIGTIGIVDGDIIEANNLSRQILYTEQDIGLLKVDCAKQRLTAQNSHIKIETYPLKLIAENTEEIIQNYDVIIDGSDNYATRYLVNDVCHSQNKPLITASIFQTQGQISIFNYQEGPCYRCLYPSPPTDQNNCALGGVVGVLPGILGTLQASEAIKLILQKGELLNGRLLTLDFLTMHFKQYQIEKNPLCVLCIE